MEVAAPNHCLTSGIYTSTNVRVKHAPDGDEKVCDRARWVWWTKSQGDERGDMDSLWCSGRAALPSLDQWPGLAVSDLHETLLVQAFARLDGGWNRAQSVRSEGVEMGPETKTERH